MIEAAALRRDAEKLAGPLPPLLVAAKRLAATVELGVHGRRRPGMGEAFWQYRQALPGDPMVAIDWRRSARSDQLFLRETEWEAAETVGVWCEISAGMRFFSDKDLPSKSERAALITLALSILLDRAGERVAAMTASPFSGNGDLFLRRFAGALSNANRDEESELPPANAHRHAHTLIAISDFLGPLEPMLERYAALAQKCRQAALIQVLDPAEMSFPYSGRVLFESVGKTLAHETRRAQGVSLAYKEKLRETQETLRAFCRRIGWQFTTHLTSQPAAPTLLWAANAVGDRPR